jgi:hypothetical protein
MPSGKISLTARLGTTPVFAAPLTGHDRCDSVEWKQFVVGTADPEVWPLKMAIVSRDTSRDSCPLPE